MNAQSAQDAFTNEIFDTTNRVVLIVTSYRDSALRAAEAAGLVVADWGRYKDEYDYSSSATGTLLERAEARSFFFA